MDRCESDDKRVKISYDLKLLQRITDDADYVVTLNADGAVDPDAVLAEMTYAHPTYTRASVAAQRELSSLQRRPDGVRRRLAGLGIPRGRLRLRGAGRRIARVRLVSR